ncbi:MAG: PAS domain S-box protein [Minicystis sp.]
MITALVVLVLALVVLGAVVLLMFRRAVAALKWQAGLLNEAHDAILVWELGGGIVYWNQGAQALYGWTASEALGRVSHDLLATEHAKGMGVVEHTLAREGRWEGELCHTTRDGRKVTVESRHVLMRSGRGRPLVLEINRDLTARRHAERALRASELRLRRLWESNIIGVLLGDAHGHIHDANDEVLRMIGYAREDVEAGRVRWSDLTPPEYGHLDQRGIAEVRAVGACKPYEKVYVAKDGRRVPIFIGYATIDPAGDDYITFVLDLTERKRAEQERAQSEARLRAMVETAVDAIITTDDHGTVESVNPATERLFGYRSEEVVGRNVSMLMPEPYRSEHDGYLERFRRTGEPRIIGRGREVRGQRKDGGTLPLELAVSEMRVGECRLFTGILRDITERKRAEAEREHLLTSERAARAEAERAARMKDEFVATVSHELRTPLNAILGWASMLQKGTLDAAAAARAVEVIMRNTRAQAQLIEDLLDASRIVTGKLRLDVQKVDLAKVIENAIAAVQLSADAKRVRLVKTLDVQAGAVHGDPTRLEQVVWNLLANAIKFTPKGGSAHVILCREGSRAEVIVEDTGQGIAEDFLPHVFERFRQADGSASRQHGGLGLGLALVKHLVEQHGGTIRAESEGEGKGATFTVSLPLAVAVRQEAEGPTPFEACASLKGLKVLVVDDEEDARDLVRRILEDCDAHVVSVGSAAEALETLPRFRPHVMLSDIGMPELDGYHLMHAVRSLAPQHGGRTPAVALTAFSRPEDRRRALRAGYQTHLSKPIDQTELVLAIANLALPAAA